MAELVAPLLFPGFVSDEVLLRSIVVVPLFLMLAGVLVAVSVIDLRKRIVPNELVAALFCLRMLLLLLQWDSGFWGWEAFAGSLVLASGVVLGCVLVATLARKLSKKESLGMGDVKLMAVGTLFLNLDQLMMMLCIAALAGLMFALFFRFARHDPTFPFAPAICLGLAAALLF